MRILGVDPGETTGLAILQINTNTYEFQTWQSESIFYVYDFIRHSDLIDLVVCEQFTWRPRHHQSNRYVNLSAPKVIGALEVACHKAGIDLVTQPPAQGKGFWTREKLTSADLWEPGKPHAMDAKKHVLVYIQNVLNDNRFLHMLKDDN